MPKFEILNWQNIRKDIARVNEPLSLLMDELALDDSFRFYKIRYKYGSRILQQGKVYLPTRNGELTPLSECAPQIIEDLNYNDLGNPIGVVLHNNFEMFVSLEDRVIPFTAFGPGTVIGLSTTLDKLTMPSNYASFFMWEFTAGTRSTFLLPKVSDRLGFERLKRKYALITPQSDELQKHWFLFRELAQKLNSPWYGELIFFPKKILDCLNDPVGIRLRNYFLESNRKVFEFWRNMFSWQVTFSRIEKLRNLKNSAHILDTIKHLFAISTGAFVAFRPANDDKSLPAKLIQEVYLNDYGLVDYIPTIMEPALFTHQEPVYYSLPYPTSVEYSPKAASGSSNIGDLEELLMVLSKFLKEIKSRDFHIDGTLLAQVPDQIRFDFYHTNPGSYANVQPIESLVAEDPRFKASATASNQEVSKSSSFFKGCIRIHSK